MFREPATRLPTVTATAKSFTRARTKESPPMTDGECCSPDHAQ